MLTYLFLIEKNSKVRIPIYGRTPITKGTTKLQLPIDFQNNAIIEGNIKG